MTHHDEGHYAKKHASDRKVDPKIAEAVKKEAADMQIACAVAFKIIKDLGVNPSEVGFTLDSMELRIVKCQLGLFGYSPDKKIISPADAVSDEMKKEIQEKLREDKLPCRAAWDLAEKCGMKKMEISSACETLGIKISPCQLGAF